MVCLNLVLPFSTFVLRRLGRIRIKRCAELLRLALTADGERPQHAHGLRGREPCRSESGITLRLQFCVDARIYLGLGGLMLTLHRMLPFGRSGYAERAVRRLAVASATAFVLAALFRIGLFTTAPA